ncbi:MAG TPA: aquaporin [Limnochordia bacterium]
MGKPFAPYVAEFIGPFALVFVGAGAILATGGQDLVAIAFAHGLVIAVMVAAAGHISGGLYNPALTVGLWITGRLNAGRALGYIVAQLLGGLVAAWLLDGTFSPVAVEAMRLGTPLLADGVSAWVGTVIEFVLTFFLMFVVFGTAVDERGPKAIAGLAIGLTITADILVGGASTGAAMNPARHFGPALVSGSWADWWVYWIGPILGAGVAAVLYHAGMLEPAPDQRRERGQ